MPILTDLESRMLFLLGQQPLMVLRIGVALTLGALKSEYPLL